MKKTLAELMLEEEGNGSKNKKEKTCQIPTHGIQQVSISNSTMNPFDSRTMNPYDLK